MNNKVLKLLIIISIIITIICAMIGFSYAIFKLQVLGNENASSIITNLGALELTFSDGQYINNTNINVGWTQSKTITITNTGTETVPYYLIWETLTNTFINKNLLTYTITNAGAGSTLSQRPVPPSGENIPILPQTSIAVGVTHTYTITFNLENSSIIDQSSDMNKIFTGKLKVVEEVTLWSDSCIAGSNKLNCSILEDNPEYETQVVINDTMFQSNATTDMGLWTENRAEKTEDDLPVYFYRGAVQNNYVDFAGKMWRIVRINEDGTIKLILGGNTTTDGYGGTRVAFNSYTYIDYSHPTNSLKAANEDWYIDDEKGNLDEYQSYIADTKFCNDKSITSTALNGIVLYYGVYERLYVNKTPQYKCPNANDNYAYKIGALTGDEIAYAGGLMYTGNPSYYIYDNAQLESNEGTWWLLSPHVSGNGIPRIFAMIGANSWVDGSCFFNTYEENSTNNFRPVISLKTNTVIFNGDGTFASPYVITQ